jgi:hypothetical protein
MEQDHPWQQLCEMVNESKDITEKMEHIYLKDKVTLCTDHVQHTWQGCLANASHL